jgi:hypothetical protein
LLRSINEHSAYAGNCRMKENTSRYLKCMARSNNAVG